MSAAPFDEPVLIAELATIKAASSAPLVVGGTAIEDEAHAVRLGADAATNSARAAVDYFDTLTRS